MAPRGCGLRTLTAGFAAVAAAAAASSPSPFLTVGAGGCSATLAVPPPAVSAHDAVVALRDARNVALECTRGSDVPCEVTLALPPAVAGPGAGAVHVYGLRVGAGAGAPSLDLLASWPLPAAAAGCPPPPGGAPGRTVGPTVGLL